VTSAEYVFPGAAFSVEIASLVRTTISVPAGIIPGVVVEVVTGPAGGVVVVRDAVPVVAAHPDNSNPADVRTRIRVFFI
jgi:hypothetical protein